MDKNYWNSFYKNHGKNDNINKHSTFAKFCLDKFLNNDGLRIVELGSGNGRDAVYFAQHKLDVTAIDQSTNAVDIAKEKLSEEYRQYLHPKAADFVSINYLKYGHIDAFYSRFTIHSISKDDEQKCNE